MRLYPPVPRFDREAVEADRLGEIEVRPGDIVSIWPWLIHRHRGLWDDPDAFDPGRFAARSQGRPPPLPIYPVRRRTAPVRRRPLRHHRGADHPCPLACRLALRFGSGPQGSALGDGHPSSAGRHEAAHRAARRIDSLLPHCLLRKAGTHLFAQCSRFRSASCGRYQLQRPSDRPPNPRSGRRAV